MKLQKTETFYIYTNKGLIKKDIIRKFTYLNRLWAMHLSYSNVLLSDERCVDNAPLNFTITDYMTGIKVCSGNSKEYLVRKAKKMILKNKNFDYNRFRQCNSYSFLAGYFLTMRLLKQKGNIAEGTKFAVEIFNNQ